MPGSMPFARADWGRSIRPPAGALFPPKDPDAGALQAVIHTTPILWGHRRPRWTLALLGETSLALHPLSPSGRWRRMQTWQVARKRSRDYLTSPDPAYREKAAQVQAAVAQAQASPTTHVVLYGDEFTYYRQPAPAFAYWTRGSGGHFQPRAYRSYRSNTKRRIIGALDQATGQVHGHSASKLGVAGLKKHLRSLRAAYGTDRHLTLVWDNWPVHTHPEVTAVAARERITLLFLPTYAPWLNPIEHLWDWLKADVLRLHPWSDQWDGLQEEVTDFLQQFAGPAPALLQYCGLAPGQQDQPQGAPP
ncbi:MAG: IS630 family transposase [Armatimonadota bacterium]